MSLYGTLNTAMSGMAAQANMLGTIGDNSLQIFTGTAMRGTWTLNIIDTDTTNGADSLTSAKLSITAAKS